jgi:DNA-binding NarL/FixJ family response regulator
VAVGGEGSAREREGGATAGRNEASLDQRTFHHLLAQLGQIGGRTRIDGLTPAERRVAALVADGRTNAEVAAALFLAAKLGVRSRTELSRRMH